MNSLCFFTVQASQSGLNQVRPSFQLPDELIGGEPMKERSRFGQEVQVAASLEVVEIQEPGRIGRLGSGHEPEYFFEERLVAGNGEWTGIGESVLFLGLDQELLEDGVVQVRRTHNESSTIGAYADRHVSGGDVGRDAAGGHRGLLAPPLEHLAESHYVLDFAAG